MGGEGGEPLLGHVLVVRGALPALEVLDGVVRLAQAGDPLSPVSVVHPAAHAAVSARRFLARRGGLLNVSWFSMPQLTERLASSALVSSAAPPLTALVQRGAVRLALSSPPRVFAPVATNPLAIDAIARAVADLGDLDDDELASVGAHNDVTAAVVQVASVTARATAAFTDRRQVHIAARQAVAGAADQSGHVVVYAPARLGRGEVDVLRALADAERLTVILVETADESGDRVVHDVAAQLAFLSRRDLSRTTVARVETSFVRAPDTDEEVRLAVRRVLAELQRGTAAEDIAIVWRVQHPYAVLVHELLDRAGIAHHGPAVGTLAQSVPGRIILGLFDVVASDFARSTFFTWLRSAPIRMPDGRRVSTRFDRLARRAGIGGGFEQWHDRLASLAESSPHRVDEIDRLRSLLDWVHDLAVVPEAASWLDVAEWWRRTLVALCGGANRVSSWPERDQQAFDRVEGVLSALGQLDALGDAPAAALVHDVLRDELGSPDQTVGRFGRGVFTGSVSDLYGAAHELVIVLGMAEGSFPPRGTDDPILGDELRHSMAGALPSSRPLRDEESRDIAAALGAAPHVVCSFARVDPRSQREQLPAQAWLAALSVLEGRVVSFRDLDDVDAPAMTHYRDVESFEAGLRAASFELDEYEAQVAAYLTGRSRPSDEPAMARGIAALRGRDGGFSAWTGAVDPSWIRPFSDDDVGSATSLERWVTCPYEYFLSRVLHVRPLDEFADADVISGRDRGSLVHGSLDRFITEHLGVAPDHTWTEAERARAHAILDEQADVVDREGRTGRRMLWQLARSRLHVLLDAILDDDEKHRAGAGVTPVATEFAFGHDADVAPLRVALAQGRSMAFRGSVDRIDQGVADPSKLMVIDYKTGKAKGYKDVATDATCGGRHLQLPLYGAAARTAFDAGEVTAAFWFVEEGVRAAWKKATIDAAADARLQDVLEVVVDGIESGTFPANPGDEDRFGFSNCGWCEYDRVCPASRGDVWQRVQLHERLDAYHALDDPS